MPKGDKKKKKEVTIEIALLEAKLEEAHKQQIIECCHDSNNENVSNSPLMTEIDLTIICFPPRGSPGLDE